MKRVYMHDDTLPLWHVNSWVTSSDGIHQNLFEKVNIQIAITVQRGILGDLYLRDMQHWDPGVERMLV